MSYFDYDVVIAVDVGLSGGIAFFDTVSGELLSVYTMPTVSHESKTGKIKNSLDIDKLMFILEIPKAHDESAILVMENIHAFPGQGVVAVGTLLEQKGILRGLACGLGYEVELVEPRTWQKMFDLIPPEELKGSTGTKTKTLRKKWLKENSLTKARELFPKCADTKLSKSTAHGLSDALLIGKWFIDRS